MFKKNKKKVERKNLKKIEFTDSPENKSPDLVLGQHHPPGAPELDRSRTRNRSLHFQSGLEDRDPGIEMEEAEVIHQLATAWKR